MKKRLARIAWQLVTLVPYRGPERTFKYISAPMCCVPGSQRLS